MLDWSEIILRLGIASLAGGLIGLNRDLHGKLGQKSEGPQDQLKAMDEDGIDVMVLYPTAGLHVSALHEKDYATGITRAYNDWLFHF